MYTKVDSSVVMEMLKSSLDHCREKMGGGEVLGLLMENDPNAIEHFRYGLAIQVCIYLVRNSELIESVYIYPDTLDEDPMLTLPLTLIVHVAKHTAALESIVEALERNLLDEYRSMFSPVTDHLSIFLHVCLVDDANLLSRKGLAVCIGSIYRPALRVWSKVGEQETPVIKNETLPKRSNRM